MLIICSCSFKCLQAAKRRKHGKEEIEKCLQQPAIQTKRCKEGLEKVNRLFV